MTDWSVIAAEMVSGTKALLEKELVPLRERIALLETRLAESKALSYAGVYQRASSYARGDAVTHQGCLWYATQATTETPGSSPQWQLMAKGTSR